MCGYIIFRDNLLFIVFFAGFIGVVLDFMYGVCVDVFVIDEFGRIFFNVCRVFFGGVCVFFLLFKYVDEVYVRWEFTGVMAFIRGVKDVYCELCDVSILE